MYVNNRLMLKFLFRLSMYNVKGVTCMNTACSLKPFQSKSVIVVITNSKQEVAYFANQYQLVVF